MDGCPTCQQRDRCEEQAGADEGGHIGSLDTEKERTQNAREQQGCRQARDDDLLDLEFNAICRREGYRIIEVPLFSTSRRGGRSTTSSSPAFRAVASMVSSRSSSSGAPSRLKARSFRSAIPIARVSRTWSSR